MAKFHVNPETGRASQCAASFKCPFGDLESDHYATAAEARKSYEQKMQAEAETQLKARKEKAAKRLGDPIIYTDSPDYRVSKDAKYYIDYDYDTEGGEVDEYGMHRGSSIVDMEIKGWERDGEGLADFAKASLGLPHEKPIPEELRKNLQPFVTNFDSYDFEAETSPGYYGEELDSITVPDELLKVLDDYYYSQPNAAGPENILGYLRGKGYDTTGERPLEAIKGALQAENKGRLSTKVTRARKWRIANISLANITVPSDAQAEIGEKDPRSPSSPYPGRQNPRDIIAGVVLQKNDGTYELIDGYHRRGWLKANGKKKPRYIILSHEAWKEPSRYSSYSKEVYWNKD